MAVQLMFLSRNSAAVLLGCLALSACGATNEAETQTTPETADAASAGNPAASSLASLTPQEVMLRALGCEKALTQARLNPGRLDDEMNALVSRTPELTFRDLVFAGFDFDVTSEARQDAYKAGKHLSDFGAGVSPEMVAYLTECSAVSERAASLMAQAKAAKDQA